MAPELLSSLKRKAQPAEAGSDDDRLEDGLLNGVLSASEDDDDDDGNDDESDVEEEEEIPADEVPSDDGGLVPANQTTTKQPDSVVELNGHGPDRDGAEVGGGGDDDDDADADDSPNYRITTSANGGVRYEYDEIDPVYDSDDSDAQGPANNTIGNIPLSFYDSYPHIGYDINGRKILRPATGEALDALLDSIEVPKGWTGLTDPETGKPLNLSQDELELLRRLQMNEVPEEGFDPYPEMVEYFTSIEEKMPLSAAPEPKRRFIPSKHEHRRIMKMVRAIRQGRILPYKPPEEVEREKAEAEAREGAGAYDLWANEQARELHVPHIPAPKLQAPGYDLSYNPPAEYLPTPKERDAWEAMDPEDREREYLPARFDALRRVPAYDGLVKERFERCLDLYLAPRIRRTRLNMDPASLLPKLPRPEELRPFPTTCQTVFRGHDGRVRSVSVSPDGLWLASGGDDGTVRVWAMNGHQEWAVRIGGAAEGAKRGEEPGAEPVTAVRWRPGADACVLAAASGEDVFFMVPPACGSAAAERAGRDVLDAGFGYAQAAAAAGGNRDREAKRDPPGRWARPGARLEAAGVLVKVTVRAAIKVISWHRRGDFLATTSPSGRNSSVAIHTISRHLTQIPFRRLAGLAQAAHFHPARPLLFVATQRSIRAYDLQRQELVRVLQPGARWISSFDIHPGGDNVIVGSYDRRLAWHDLDLSARPYRTMRFHTEAVRAARFHRGSLPLFADASDDGTVQVFHGRVVADLMENATIVPVKMLRGHRVVSRLGVLDLDWHPRHPWLLSGGADGTCRLWT